MSACCNNSQGQGEGGPFACIYTMLRRIAVHLKRPLGWRLADNIAEPTESEAKTFNMSRTEVCNVMQKYLVWRRSSMLVSLPILLYATFGGLVDIDTFRKKYYEDGLDLNGLGTVLRLLPMIADAFLLLGVFGALIRWHKWHYTSRVITYGWLVATVLPLIPAVIPTHLTVNDNISRFQLSIEYGIQILPLILAIPWSCGRAALRIRGLIPDSSFSSWLISIVAPFRSLLTLVSVIMIIQMAGNFWLVIAALLQCVSPWHYVIHRKLYVGIKTDENEKQIDKKQKIMLYITIVSLILVVVWGHMPLEFATDSGGTVTVTPIGSDPNSSLMTYNNFFRWVFEGFGRYLVNTVVFGDMILRMTVENFQHSLARIQDDDTWQSIQEIFQSLEYITQPEQTNDEADIEPNTETAELMLLRRIFNFCCLKPFEHIYHNMQGDTYKAEAGAAGTATAEQTEQPQGEDNFQEDGANAKAQETIYTGTPKDEDDVEKVGLSETSDEQLESGSGRSNV